jgi:adenylosuccinate lyase
VAAELPFMATEEMLVRAVRGGGDRQAAHETIRRHSMAAALVVKDGGSNDLLSRLASDESFGVSLLDLESAAAPDRFVGRAPAQVDEFLAEIVQPILSSAPADAAGVDVRV